MSPALDVFVVYKKRTKMMYSRKKYVFNSQAICKFHDGIFIQTLGLLSSQGSLFLDLFRTQQDRNRIVATEVAKNAKSSKSGSSCEMEGDHRGKVFFKIRYQPFCPNLLKQRLNHKTTKSWLFPCFSIRVWTDFCKTLADAPMLDLSVAKSPHLAAGGS